jgi:hypothetical protein
MPDMRLALVLLVAAAASGQDPFPMEKGTEWTCRGTVETEEGGHRVKRSVTWKMLIEGHMRNGDLDVATLLGAPQDLAFNR